MTNTHVDLY